MMDEAAAIEIERLKALLETAESATTYWFEKYRESERQRKKLSEHIETLAKGGIEAATGAGK